MAAQRPPMAMRKPSRSLLWLWWSTERASQKISNQLCDLVWLLVERKVAGIEDVDLRPGQIALISGRLGNQERGVVLAPNDQRGRLMQPQPNQERLVFKSLHHRDTGLIRRRLI